MAFSLVYGISCVTSKGNLMKVKCDSLFCGLNVNTRYYISVFKKVGVKNRFFLDRDDLKTIVDNLPTTRYKTALVVERAKSALEGENVETH